MPTPKARYCAWFAGSAAVALLTCCGEAATAVGVTDPGTENGGAIDALGGRAGNAGLSGNGGGQSGTGADANGGSQGTIGCGTVASDANRVVPSVMAGAAPEPQGGALTSGTYVLSALVYYLSGATCSPPSVKAGAVIRVSATSATSGVIEEITNQTAPGLNIKDSRDSLTYTASDQVLTLDYTCTGVLSAFTRNASNPVSYTAGPTEIRTFGPNAPCGVSVSVFTKK